MCNTMSYADYHLAFKTSQHHNYHNNHKIVNMEVSSMDQGWCGMVLVAVCEGKVEWGCVVYSFS